MKFWEIFRFEFLYQARRVRTWLYFVAFFVVAYLITRNRINDALNGNVLFNSPYFVAATTVISSMLWVVMATAVAGTAGARDVQTRMHPLIYTAPISKAEYLGGRFLAAFVLNALIMITQPAGILLGQLGPGVEPDILGPFRPATYFSTYFFISLPTAFAVVSIQFSLATLTRRAVSSYIGSVILFITSFLAGAVTEVLHMPTLGKLLDPIGFSTILGMHSRAWTPIEKNTILIGLEPSMLAKDLLWIGIGLGLLAFTHLRFRFTHHEATSKRSRLMGDGMHSTGVASIIPVSIPHVPRTFGLATHVRQTIAIAWTSFATIAKSARVPFLLAFIALLLFLLLPIPLQRSGTPLLPRTAQVLVMLTAPIAENPIIPWAIIPLLIVYFAGELVWRERDAGLSEMADTIPVPEWVFLLGKFLGLSFVLVVCMALLMTAGVLIQVRMGYFNFEIGLYLRVLFGIQLIDYILFALLVFVVHVVVNQKHLGYLVALIVYAIMTFPSNLGIEHKLLIYGAAPGWNYTDMRGFGPSVRPWLWFKLYWGAWALLLAVVAKALWVRGKERGVVVRLRMARRRLTYPTIGVSAAAIALILALGGFIFYNTNVLNAYYTTAQTLQRSAEYERRYGQYKKVPQPLLTKTNLHVEIYPERCKAEIRGSYQLVNDEREAIDSIHLSMLSRVETRAITLDQPADCVVADDDLGYRIYSLKKPLQPGESIRLDFEVHFAPRGFSNSGIDTAVVANGTYFTNRDWLPAIGYQRSRELSNLGDRRMQGFAKQEVASLDDHDAEEIRDLADAPRIDFEAIVGTDHDQIIVAPGVLERTWMEGGRRYFHYATDVPIKNKYALYSANYAVREERWNNVAIQIFHHPEHSQNLEHIVRSVQASLTYYTQQFGPYPYSYLRLVENPARGMGAHADATTIDYGEKAFALLDPDKAPQNLDLVFAVTAHEVAHQWWGAAQVSPANIEGAGLMAEGLATYSAMRVIEDTLGPEYLRQFLRFLHNNEDERQPSRAAPPLLQASDWYLSYRKGPLALYALGEYIGKERVHTALRRLVERYGSGEPPPPTSLDLFRELKAVTPDEFQLVLHDLFEANTFWELKTERVTAQETDVGTWQVTLDVQARKMVVDQMGVETELPMDDWVEVGVFDTVDDSEASVESLYLQKHRIRSDKQTITVTVPRKPARAGIDPRYLLNDWTTDDNIRVASEAAR